MASLSKNSQNHLIAVRDEIRDFVLSRWFDKNASTRFLIDRWVNYLHSEYADAKKLGYAVEESKISAWNHNRATRWPMFPWSFVGVDFMRHLSNDEKKTREATYNDLVTLVKFFEPWSVETDSLGSRGQVRPDGMTGNNAVNILRTRILTEKDSLEKKILEARQSVIDAAIKAEAEKRGVSTEYGGWADWVKGAANDLSADRWVMGGLALVGLGLIGSVLWGKKR